VAETILADGRSQRRAIGIATVALVGWACWRTQFGADSGDGAHSVALALRLAEGAEPFVDETNTQATGSLLAVPFVAAWKGVFGTSGIVLATRLWYVALCLVIGVLAYRALRQVLPAWVAFAVPATALVPTAYNLMLLNYTTAPSLAILLATTSGVIAVERGSGRWGILAGATPVLAAFSHPAALPSAALLLATLLLLCRRTRAWRSVAVGAVATSTVLLLWVLLVVGLPHLLQTLTYTMDYQSTRLTPSQRVAALWDVYAGGITSLAYLPTGILALLACAPSIRPRVRATLLLCVVVAVATPSLASQFTDAPVPLPFGRFSGVYATIAIIGMAVPGSLAVARAKDPPMTSLLALSLPPALISLPTVAATSSAGPYWGAAAIGVATAFGALSAVPAWLATTERRPSPAFVAAAALVPLLAVVSVQTMVSFRDPSPWQQTARVHGGAFAGIRGTPERVLVLERIREEVDRATTNEDSVFVFGSPAAYLFVPGRMNTNIVWTPLSGPANQFTIDYFDEREDFPDVVLLWAGRRAEAGGEGPWRNLDPMVDYFHRHYEIVDDGSDSLFIVLRRSP